MKRLVSLLLLVAVLVSFGGTIGYAVTESVSQSGGVEIQPFAEQTEWRYREINGVRQMRLWSLTYGYWKTDWITIV